MSELDEPMHLAEYDASWPHLSKIEALRIQSALGVPPTAIEHIGSTAVPGLVAKPIVDLMLGTAALPPPPATVSTLQGLGYQSLGEAGVPGRHYFRLRGPVSINLHVVRQFGEHWTTNIALRDYLRSDADARARYAAAKRAAVAAGAHTLLTYSDAKADSVARLVKEACARMAARDG
jgi:GrpB-like predicted nucleotidyltransferase (UPF0157 family)